MAPADRAPYPDVRPVLPAERAAFVDLLACLTAAEWAAPTECPAWSVAGVALHILGDDLSLLSRQRDAAPPGLFAYAEDHPGLDFRGLLDGFNEQWVRAASFLSPSLVLELLRLTGEWSAAYYDGVDPEGPSEPVGFFGATGPSPFWQVYGREYVERWVHHHQVRRAVGQPDLGVDFLVPAVEVVTRGLAAHLPGLDAADGTTIALTIPTVGVWALSREAEAWVAKPRRGRCRGRRRPPPRPRLGHARLLPGARPRGRRGGPHRRRRPGARRPGSQRRRPAV